MPFSTYFMFNRNPLLLNSVVIVGKVDAAYIPTGRGKKNLVLDGFSFSETPPGYWVCARRKNLNCRATARTNKLGEVIRFDNTHNHPKPKFYSKTAKKMITL